MCTFQQAISHIKEDKLMHPVHLKKSASTEPLSPKNVAILMWKSNGTKHRHDIYFLHEAANA